MAKKKTKKVNRTTLIKKADSEFSRYVRRTSSGKDGWVACFTCEKRYEWKKLHNGHFMSRRHMNTRWHEHNTAPQCAGCNTFRGGEQYIFGKNLDKKYGVGTAEEMEVLSRQITKMGIQEIEEIHLKYKQLNKKLDESERNSS